MPNLLLDLLFPRRCVSCKKFGSFICTKCQKQIIYIDQNICPVCGRSSIYGTVHPGCKRRYCLDGLFSACMYRGVVKKAIHQFKYRPYLSGLSETLFKILQKGIKNNQNNQIGAFLQNNKPLVVPIPLYQARQRQRGYNQAEILGKALAQKYNLSFCPDLLIRIKPTKPQAYLKFHQRAENIKNAFKSNPNTPHVFISSYHHILLIDDIWTTGSTLKTAANLLKRKGFKIVWGITLAR